MTSPSRHRDRRRHAVEYRLRSSPDVVLSRIRRATDPPGAALVGTADPWGERPVVAWFRGAQFTLQHRTYWRNLGQRVLRGAVTPTADTDGSVLIADFVVPAFARTVQGLVVGVGAMLGLVAAFQSERPLLALFLGAFFAALMLLLAWLVGRLVSLPDERALASFLKRVAVDAEMPAPPRDTAAVIADLSRRYPVRP